MADDPINGNGGTPPANTGLPDSMTELALVKAKLGITATTRDAFLHILIKSVHAELAEINGIRLNEEQKQRLDVIDLIADMAAFKFQNHGGPLPPNLRLRLNNLYVKYAGVDQDAGE